MFSDLPRRAELLSLQEGASVAHYLRALSRLLPEREDRLKLLQQTQSLWRVLLGAPRKPRSKTAARRFLRRYAETHLGGLDVEWLLSVLDTAPSVKAEEPTRPQMMSRNRAVSGDVNPYLLDNLSERVFATC